MKRILVVLFVFTSVNSWGNGSPNIYPTNWWVGMKNPNLQIMIHRDRVANEKISLLPYPGVKLVKQTKVANIQTFQRSNVPTFQL